MTNKHSRFDKDRNFDGGLEGLYTDGFPLLHQFVFQFTTFMATKFPTLKAHFDDLMMPPECWLQ
jgi:hypothetical protein